MAERFAGRLERRGSGTLIEVPFDVRADFGTARPPVHGRGSAAAGRRTPTARAVAMLRDGVKHPEIPYRAVCAERMASISSSRPTPFLRQLAAPAFSAASIICGSS
jgi:hypothetical protein